MTVTYPSLSTSGSYTITGSWTYTQDLTLSKNDPKIILIDGSSSAEVQNISGNLYYNSLSTGRDHIFRAGGSEKIRLDMGDPSVKINSTKVLGAQQGAVADSSGGAVVDAEARTAINSLLAACRTHGLIAT